MQSLQDYNSKLRHKRPQINSSSAQKDQRQFIRCATNIIHDFWLATTDETTLG